MNCFRSLPLLFAFNFAATVFGADQTEQPPPSFAASQPWSLENVEILPTKKVTWGRLDNGLRYAIMPHASPPGRLSMRLLVTAGSLSENDDERGFAHFVEHMAFNGTKHFPAGELVKFLQRQGAAFGPHVNAFTTPNHTLYKLELPDNSTATLETGLRIFRDYADGILFEPAEVKRERGVILSEERSRHSREETRRLAFTELLYQGTRIPDRQPIGLISQIENANAAALRKFYDTWYRPENMVVVIIGQIDAAQAGQLLRTYFSTLAARLPARPVPPVGEIAMLTEPVVSLQTDPISGFDVGLIKITGRKEQPNTWGTQLKGLRLHSAFTMLARRLERLTQIENRIISNSSASTEVEFGKFRKMSVSVSSSPNDWQKALALAEQETRRVIAHGFTSEELAYHQTGMRNLYHSFAKSIDTISSTEISDAIVETMEDDTPFSFTGEGLEYSLQMTDRLTAEDCQRAFREYWGDQPPRLFVKTAAEFLPSAEKVRDVFAASQKVPVEKFQATFAREFGYQDFGPPGEIAEKTHVADLDVWLVRFANGVRLNLKRTPFENGLVRYKVRIGNGDLGMSPDQPGLNLWTAAWWLGGVGKHTRSELTQLMIDAANETSAGNGEDALLLNGNARTQNLPRALRELTAFVVDPAFRPEGYNEMAAILHGQLDPLWHAPEGPVQRFVFPFLAGNNPRIGVPDPTLIFARTPDEIRAWITPQLESGAMEIAVVGDMDVDAVIAEVAKTFGTLPTRQPKPTLEAERKLQFPQQPVSNIFYYTGPADHPATLEFFWPVRDSLTAAQRRRLPMLATILEARVTQQVREKKSATYSPNVGFFASDTYPGLAAIRCTLQVKPRDAVLYGDAIRELAGKLSKKGVTADELARAKAQSLAAQQGAKTDNGFWLNNILSDAQERPSRLDNFRSSATDIAGTSVADLNVLASKYLGSDRAYRYIIEPNARMPKQKSRN